MARRLWHFTNEVHLAEIRADGLIRMTEANVTFARERSRTVVWLLDVPALDHDHGLGVARVSIDGGPLRLVPMDDVPAEWDKRRVRIEVRLPDHAASPWLDWSKAHATTDARDRLIRTGGGYAAAKHWWVAEYAIPRTRWTAVERLSAAGEWEAC